MRMIGVVRLEQTYKFLRYLENCHGVLRYGFVLIRIFVSPISGGHGIDRVIYVHKFHKIRRNNGTNNRLKRI